jgi:hypothetical protein
MSGTQTGEYDVLYEISIDRFTEVLRERIVRDLPLALGNVPVAVDIPLLGRPLTSPVSQTGTVALGSISDASVVPVPGSSDAFTLRATFDSSSLTLLPVAAGGIPGVAIPGVGPGTAGGATLTLPLRVSTQPRGAGSPVTFSLDNTRAVDLSPLDRLPWIPYPALAPGNTAAQVVQRAVKQAVAGAAALLFPQEIPIALSTSGPCGFFPRELGVKLLPGAPGVGGTPGTVDALGLLVGLRSAGTPRNPASVASSSLPASASGVLVVSNRLLIDLVCCVLPERIPALVGVTPTPTNTATEVCCSWSNLRDVNLGGAQFTEVGELRLCLETQGFRFEGRRLIQRGTGWWVEVRFDIRVAMRRSGGAIVPFPDNPDIDVDAFLEWWVWLVAGIVGAILGAVAGFVGGVGVGAAAGAVAGAVAAGAAIGAAVGVAVAAALQVPLGAVAESLGTALAGVLAPVSAGLASGLQLLPPDLTAAFGTLELTGDPVIDDVSLAGRVALRPGPRPVAESGGLVLAFGGMLDLDRGQVLAAPEPGEAADLDADLAWEEPGHGKLGVSSWESRFGWGLSKSFGTGGVSARGSARLVAVSGASFWSLTEGDLERLAYPARGGRISFGDVPLAGTKDPVEPRVFAVRTSEGRYAKCAAWRDAGGQLHLRFLTYDTPLRLWLQAGWHTTRGRIVPSTIRSVVPTVEYQLSRRGTFTAMAPRLHAPVSYTWFWDGRLVSGAGTLPDGTTRFEAAGSTFRLETRMGDPLNGELCVRARDATGFEATACRNLDFAGTETKAARLGIEHTLLVNDLARVLRQQGPDPDPAPDVWRTLAVLHTPVAEQLPQALARGMKVEVGEIELR